MASNILNGRDLLASQFLVTGEVIEISDWDFMDTVGGKWHLNAVYVSGFILYGI